MMADSTSNKQQRDNMNKIQTWVVGTVVLASFSGAALAEGSNLYAAIDFGQTTVKDACTNITSLGFSCKDTDTAVRGSLGYQVNPSLGVEGSYGNYGASTVSGLVSGIPVSGKVAFSGFQLTAVGSLPLNESFALTGKLGVAFTKLETSGAVQGIPVVSKSTNSTTLAYGIGARYNINKSIALRAQYENLGKVGDDTTEKSTVTLLSAGAIFSF